MFRKKSGFILETDFSDNIILKGLRLLSALLFALIIVLLLTVKNENYIRPWDFCAAVILMIFFYFIKFRVKKIPSKKWIVLCSFLFGILQILVVRSYVFETGWDVWTLLRASEMIASDMTIGTEYLSWFNKYFSMYTNNIVITQIYAILLRLFPTNPSILIIIYTNCLLSAYTSYLVFRTVALIRNDSSGFTAWCLYWIVLGLSPWISITYSDPLVLIFPVISFYLYFLDKNNLSKTKECSGRQLFVHILLIGAIFIISGVGYHIKPQILIPAIAILICLILGDLFSRNYIGMLINLSAALFGLYLSILLCRMLSISQLTLNAESAFSPTHWIMMGLNPESLGRYSLQDVTYSQSFLTKAERMAGNLSVIVDRLKDYGVMGYLQLLKTKLTICMGDGTLYWAKNTGDFFNVVYANDSFLGEITKEFYYTDGIYYNVFSAVSNILWVFLLLSIFVGQLFSIRKQADSDLTVIYLTLLGLIMFELIFEVFTRHLYSFVPLFIIVAERGLSDLSHIISKRFIEEDQNE